MFSLVIISRSSKLFSVRSVAMGNKASKAKVSSCRFPDRGTLDRRIYQLQLISRAIEILSREIKTRQSIRDFANLQDDVMNYTDERDVPDPVLTVTDPVRGKVTFRPHDWKILLDDPLFVQWDRQNPFDLFRQPIVGRISNIEAARENFGMSLERFIQARATLWAALPKDCI